MRRLRSAPDLLRIALLTSLGLTACGGNAADPQQNPASNGGSNSNTGGHAGGDDNGGAGTIGGAPNMPATIPDGEHCGELIHKYEGCGMDAEWLHTSCVAETDREKCMIECQVANSCADLSNEGYRVCQRTCDGPILPVEREPCGESTPLLGVNQVTTGLEQCASGVVHRAVAARCEDLSSADAAVDGGADAGGGGADGAENSVGAGSECATDSDCTASALGFCDLTILPPGFEPFGSCVYGCLEDSDCGGGQVCVCGAPYGRCLEATCTTDADCDDGFLCAQVALGEAICGAPPYKFMCQQAVDECDELADCTEAVESGPSGHYYCSGELDHRTCEPPSGAVCGRPFLVEGYARLAEASCGEGWQQSDLSVTVPSEALRQRLSLAWTEIGLMEHASIAAFARFQLQLLQLGAPAALIEATNQALVDETEHAKLCFALASRYAGAPVGPGSLPMAGALEASSLREIVLNTVLEGCVGETVAALEAAEAAAHASDPVVREVLQKIHSDELRHSQLAWRFVAWALERGSDDLRAAVRAAFERLAAEAQHGRCQDAFDHETPMLLAHGVISETLRASLRSVALREVVLPCAEQMLASAHFLPAPTNMPSSEPLLEPLI